MVRANWIRVLVLSLMLGSALPALAQSPKPLSMDDVQKLVDLGIADKAIVSNLQKNGVRFSVNPEALEQLRTAGASDAVIAAIEAAGAASRPAATAKAVTYADVLSLVQIGVDDAEILKVLHGSPTVFTLSQDQVDELKAAGASSTVVSAMTGQRPQSAQSGDITDFAIVLDCSGSMKETTSDGETKMEAAKRVVADLVRNVPNGMNLTFIVYGHEATGGTNDPGNCNAVRVVRPLSPLDEAGKTELIQYIQRLRPTGATPIARALQTASEQLELNNAMCGLVLISDGKETCNGDPTGVAARMAQNLKLSFGISVIGFDVGDAEREALQAISTAGGGQYYNPRNGADLALALDRVQQELQVQDIAYPVVLHSHQYPINTVVFSADGKQLLSSDEDLVLRWNVQTGKEIEDGVRSDYFPSGCFSHDGLWLASPKTEQVVLTEMNGNRTITSDSLNSYLSPVAFSLNTTRLVVAHTADSKLLTVGSVWDMDTQKWYHFNGFQSWCTVSATAISPDGKTAAAAENQGHHDEGVWIWDVETGNEKWHLGNRQEVTAMMYHPNGRYLALGQTLPTINKAGTIVLCDVTEQMEVGEFRGHDLGVTALSFSPDGKQMLSASLDGTVRLWDVATQSELAVFTGHEEGSTCVAFSPDGRLAASGGKDKTVRIGT